MIRNEAEYKEAVKRIEHETKLLAQQRKTLKEAGVKGEALEIAMQPLLSFQNQLKEEVSAYEQLKRGNIGEFCNLEGLGRTLVALRLARGLTQRELAERLGVHETQVSRDERNEYHGITVERAANILNALHVSMVSKFEEPVLPESKGA